MSKQKRSKGKRQQTQKAHTVRFSHVGWVQLAPARESKTPFCAYYGPNGETCAVVRGLERVFTLPSSPPVTYCACPLHYAEVHQKLQVFLASLGPCSRRVS